MNLDESKLCIVWKMQQNWFKTYFSCYRWLMSYTLVVLHFPKQKFARNLLGCIRPHLTSFSVLGSGHSLVVEKQQASG